MRALGADEGRRGRRAPRADADRGAPELAAAAALLRARLDAGGTLLAFGNGGSATDAMDAVADFRAAAAAWPPRRALDLTEDAAILTALANDIGAEVLFARQLIAYGRAGDVALAISTSGSSANVIAALAEARRRGLATIALVGYDGGRIPAERLADHVIVTRSEHVPRIQEAQASAYHVAARAGRALHVILRVLFTFAGGTGHLLPLVPLARAAAAAGHDVAFACQPEMVAVVEAEGFAAAATGGATLRTEPTRTPLLPLDEEREARAVSRTFARRVPRERAAALVSLLRERPADLVVRDEVDLGAAVAAERLGLPHATVLCTAAGFLRPELVAGPLAELRAEHDLPPDPPPAVLVLSPFPPSLRADGTGFRVLSPHPPEPGPTTVLVTLGTIFVLESGDLLERVLAGVGSLPVQVVATVGRQLDPADLGPQPPNVRVERWVPQAALLPRCSLVVSHAGSGSVVGALAHGLPMVLLPLGADQPQNARRCAELGVARVLDAVQATPRGRRAAAAEVLSDPDFRRCAERIRDEIAALPGPEEAVRLLEQVVA